MTNLLASGADNWKCSNFQKNVML